MIDCIRLDDATEWPAIAAAAAQAGLSLVDHRLQEPRQAVSIRLAGGVLAVASAGSGEDVLLMLAGLRKRFDGRIILLSAVMAADQRILARSLGVDHILPTPIDERELAAVLVNATRGTAGQSSRPREGEEHQRWRINGERWSLVAPSQREVRLTRAEFGVVQILTTRAGEVVPRADLVEAMNGSAGRGSGRTLDVLISRLRRKVWENTQMELPLRSARNAGYVFAGTMAAPVAVGAAMSAATLLVRA